MKARNILLLLAAMPALARAQAHTPKAAPKPVPGDRGHRAWRNRKARTKE